MRSWWDWNFSQEALGRGPTNPPNPDQSTYIPNTLGAPVTHPWNHQNFLPITVSQALGLGTKQGNQAGKPGRGTVFQEFQKHQRKIREGRTDMQMHRAREGVDFHIAV